MDAQQIQGILGLGLPSGGTSGSGWFDSFALPLSKLRIVRSLMLISFLSYEYTQLS